MIEKLFPLDLPPGLVNNGTTYQSKGRWFLANLVRFYEGTIQPVGGWSERAITGAANVGVPNCAISWQTNDGQPWIAIGTTTNLYVIDSTNKRWDITPSFTINGQPIFWQLDTFGTYLVATYNGPGTNTTEDINAFVWTGSVGVPAQPVGLKLFDPIAPTQTFGIVTTPERFLFLLQGGDPVFLSTTPSVIFRASRSGAAVADLVP